MARYDVVPVFPAPPATDARGETYVPGLYALRGQGDVVNVYADFFDRYDRAAERRRLWDENWKNLEAVFKTRAEFERAFDFQLETADANIALRAQRGRLVGDAGFGCFINLRAGSKGAGFARTAAQKYRSAPAMATYSIIRLYGIQFGTDLVVVTACAVKLSRATQDDPALQRKVEHTEQWATILDYLQIRPNYFQGYKTLPIEIA